MRLSGLLKNRLFGFKFIEVSALIVLIALAVSVYLAKVGGGEDSQQITQIEREIRTERQRVRLLQAEVAFQEQPERIGRLSAAQLQYAPATPKNEVTAHDLVDVARGARPLPPRPVAPAPVSSTPGADEETSAPAEPALPGPGQ